MSKRPRVVSGPGTHGTYTQDVAGVGGGREREPKSVSAQFDEFRKRHIKQNKEIIAANVAGNIAMAAVQAEVFALRSEILQVRQRNIALSRELRKRSRAQPLTKGLNSAQRQAVETILAAVPALQQLLSNSLNVSPPTPQSDPDWLIEDPPNISTPPSCQMPLIFTSRPAAIAAATKNRGLGPLTEGSECGSEVDHEDLTERKAAISTKLKTIGIEPTTTRPPSPPSRLPKSLPSAIIATDQSPLLSSPSSRASPRRRSRGGQNSRKRRESGLLAPLVPPIPAEHQIAEMNGDAEGTARDEEAVLDLIGDEVKEERISQNSERQDNRGKVTSPNKRSQQGSNGEGSGGGKLEGKDDSGQVGRSSRSVSEEVGEGEDGNGGRGRRSRNSVVSYKEPSLNKKMRKPDGTPVEDALRGAANNINPQAGPAGSLSSSISTSPLDDLPDTVSSKPTSADHHVSPISNSAMRRKSILPRQGNRQLLEVDNSPDNTNDMEPPERVIRRSRSNPAFNAIAEASSHPPARSSPRKSNHKPHLLPNRPSSHLANTIDPRRSVSSTSSGKEVGGHPDNPEKQRGKSRDPLVDRNDNGRKGDGMLGGRPAS